MGLRLHKKPVAFQKDWKENETYIKLYCDEKFIPYQYLGETVTVSLMKEWLETYNFCGYCKKFLQSCIDNNITCDMF